MFDQIRESVEFIQSKAQINPVVGIVLGSGLGNFVNGISDQVIISYEEIPHFHQTSVEGHCGRLILGKVHGIHVAVLQGRLHLYEGYQMDEIVFPVRVLASLGIENLILTNAAGAVNESYTPGQLILIDDHLNLMGNNPLVGPNLNELGPRFPDMSFTYSPKLKKLATESALELDYQLQSGVYAAMLGPTYETPAEVRMVRVLGGDMVGMSTVPEAIAANHIGINILGFSCITNMAAGIKNQVLDHSEIKEQATKVMEIFTKLLQSVIKKLDQIK